MSAAGAIAESVWNSRAMTCIGVSDGPLGQMLFQREEQACQENQTTVTLFLFLFPAGCRT
jgi:hypothetical protein